MKALLDIGNERIRQVDEEGLTTDSDDQLYGGILAEMGAAYALYASNYRGFCAGEETPSLAAYRKGKPDFWAGPDAYWKPKDPRRDLVRAAALILAEIERIDRGVL